MNVVDSCLIVVSLSGWKKKYTLFEQIYPWKNISFLGTRIVFFINPPPTSIFFWWLLR